MRREAYMGQPEIPAELVIAYRSTEYCVASPADFDTGASPTFVLRIDQYSEPLSRLFFASGHRCAAFITACNPFSLPQSPELNHAACAHLRGALIHHTSRPEEIIEGEARDPSGAWSGEKSFLALGLDLETSKALGRRFEQNAIVWAGADAIPRLVFLR